MNEYKDKNYDITKDHADRLNMLANQLKINKQPTEYFSKLYQVWKPILPSDRIYQLKKYKYKLR